MSVDIGSETYKIDADFRTIMNVEGIIFGKKVTDDQKKFAAEMMKEIDIEEKDAIQNAKYYDALKLFYNCLLYTSSLINGFNAILRRVEFNSGLEYGRCV